MTNKPTEEKVVPLVATEVAEYTIRNKKSKKLLRRLSYVMLGFFIGLAIISVLIGVFL